MTKKNVAWTSSLGLFLVILVGLAACNSDRQYDNYKPDPSFNSGNLNVTQANHPHGYGRAECFVCHLPINMHQVDRLGNNAAQLALAVQYVNNQGLSSCRGCHGNNGIL